ncbi:MAG: phage integrase SAM-like domain-containing protein [Bacteroidota bacterium]
MATIKLILDQNYTKKGKQSDSTYPLVIKVSHRSRWKNIQMGYQLTEEQWDNHEKKVTRKYSNSGRANARIANRWAIATEVISLPKSELKSYDVYQLVQLIENKFDQQSNGQDESIKEIIGIKYIDVAQPIIEHYLISKRFSSAKWLKDASATLLKFHGNQQLLIRDIDHSYLERLEAYWLGKGNKLSGLGSILRAIRRVYNAAIKDKSTKVDRNMYPFGNGGYRIKAGRSKKRAIDVEELKKIKNLNFEKGSKLWHAKNYMLFMFHARGMNFIDLAYLTKDKIYKDRLIYDRRKTQRGDNVKTFNIKLTTEAQSILNLYKEGNYAGNLVFPVLSDYIELVDDALLHKKYLQKLFYFNRYLKKIGQTIGLETILTSYVIRHTFATAGIYKGISKLHLGDMLGHTDAKTTEAYFADFDKTVLDEAADKILEEF